MSTRPAELPLVLVVEDEALQRRDIESVLTAAGFAVLAVDRTERALALLEQRDDISAVVTDIRLPGDFDGFVVAWRACRQPRPVPVIIVSAFVHAGYEKPAFSFRYLAKPLVPHVLIREVREAIARHTAAGLPERALKRRRKRPTPKSPSRERRVKTDTSADPAPAVASIAPRLPNRRRSGVKRRRAKTPSVL